MRQLLPFHTKTRRRILVIFPHAKLTVKISQHMHRDQQTVPVVFLFKKTLQQLSRPDAHQPVADALFRQIGQSL